jgi:hypothetical protein
MNEPVRQRGDRLGLVLGPIAVLALLVWFASWTGEDSRSKAASAVWILCTSGFWALLWVAAGAGLGWPLRATLCAHSDNALAIQIGLGFAAMMTLDAALGALGVLQAGGGVGAWALVAIGVALLVVQLARGARSAVRLAAPPWGTWTAIPAVAVLLVAACSAPGWLWATEFGGYDALSYHLQLPKEWLALGRIEPLEHNVYSYLPGYIEAAFYHVAILRGGAIEWVYACQVLHATLTVVAAALVYQLAVAIGDRIFGSVAFAFMLGTPWALVVGSLGYNEMAATLMLAAGMLVAIDDRIIGWRQGAALGVVAAAGCGAKLTAAGLVALPLGLVLLIKTPARQWLATLIPAGIAGLLCLLPYLARNQLDAGNAVFPFATGLLGPGHWTSEQSQTWIGGHIDDRSFALRVGELWNQLLRYGLGSNPDPPNPWKPQWSILPWLGIGGLALGACSTRFRRWALVIGVVLLTQIAFWMLFTHLKSRFLLPAVVPMALGAGIGARVLTDVLRRRLTSRAIEVALAVVLILWCLQPALIYRSERSGSPAFGIGLAGTLTGDELSPLDRQELGESQLASVAVNHLLDPDAKVLLLGQSAPLYFLNDRVVYQTTWDRGPLSDVMRETADDPAAWIDALRTLGFTHLLVDETMLAIWERDGWNDPLITPDRVNALVGSSVSVVHRYPGGVTLYRLD